MEKLLKLTALLVITTILPITAEARVDTKDYWNCSSRIGGKWTFGVAPSACAAKTFISENFVKDKFSIYIFDEKRSSSSERVRYMTEMNNLVQEVAEYYIKKRKDNVSTEELKWWNRAILTITHQESFMTHYRKGSDTTLRMMRGDFGHGHGLMQIDDRYHFTSINEGRAANLVDNLFYALDIYYKGWQNAPGLSCVSSATSYYNRARAAYGAYNGGSRSACRFTNPNHKFARNDKNFKDKFDSQTWSRYISSTQVPKEIDVACLSNNSSNSCNTTPPAPPVVTPPSTPKPIATRKVLKYRGFLCALQDRSYHCISQPEQRFCLVSKYNLINEVVKTIAVKPVLLLSSEEVCGLEDGLLEIGDFINLQKNINMRATPGGLLLTTARADETYQILDVVAIAEKDMSRYYLIKRGGVKGYIYTGTKKNHKDWASKANDAKELLIPIKDSRLSVATNFGTNLRRTPGGDKLTVVPRGTEVKVLSTVIVDETNKFYIEIEYRGLRGFMYSGQIHPNYSVTDWVKFL